MKNNELNTVIIDNLIDGVILINEKGIITQVNRAAASIFGYEVSELLDENVSILMPLPHNKAHDTYIANYLSTGEAKIIGIERDVEAIRKDGSSFDMELSITEAKVDGKKYFIGFIRDITDQKESDEIIKTNSKIMRSINSALASFINADIPKKEIFDTILDKLLDITKSEYGFIGEILRKDDSAPYLKTHAITDISWNHDTRKFYKDNIRKGLEFYNLNTLFGITIRTGQYVISNNPNTDPRRGGLPAGHPPLNAYMGVPIYSGNMLIGMAGVSNRPGGYDEEMVYQLKPLLGTIGSLIASYQNLASRRKAEQELYKAQETLRKIASTDILTGLDNRASLYLKLESLFKAHKGTENTFSIMFIDIDHFKQVNDTHGHLAGDNILRSISDLLKESIRPDDIIGRYGGEEIIIGLPNCSSSNALELAERIRKLVNRTKFNVSKEENSAQISVTISIGISSINKLINDIEVIVDQADKAIYIAKDAGRNRTVVYDLSMQEG